MWRRLVARTPVPALCRLALKHRAWYQYRIAREIGLRAAPVYRPLLWRTVFIGVTGSCGKSTTKELIGGILAASMKGRVTPLTENQPEHLAQTILRTRPFDRYSVHEIGVGKAGEPHVIPSSLRLIQPKIGVVTNIGEDHISAFGSKEAIARAKSKLVEALPTDGTAVLNADDPLVLAMRSRCRAQIITYGISSDSVLRAENVRAKWPERLSFKVAYEGDSMVVQTQLCGEHWVCAALAALATALAAGVPLAAAAKALGAVPPFEGRLSPHARSDGVTFVRDDFKAPLWTVPAAFDFLAKADAPRKIVVVGTLADYNNDHRTAYVSVARNARAVADHAIFVGPNAWHVLRVRRHSRDDTVQAFNSLQAAHAYLAALLRPGDLVLLKGGWSDLLWRLMNAESEMPAFAVASTEPSVSESVFGEPSDAVDQAQGADTPIAVVGLGNPDLQHVGTRHNVGRALVDKLAERLQAEWTKRDDAFIAWTQWRGLAVCLIKPIALMNHTGPALKRAFADLDLVPRHAILLHDEVKLEPGRVRARIEGGDGGHLGVRSILHAFEDNKFRRVKIGVGLPPPGQALSDHVLARFRSDEREAIEDAMQLAVDQTLLFLNEMAGIIKAESPTEPMVNCSSG
jgi:aminoacyl-tRNA hydrolase